MNGEGKTFGFARSIWAAIDMETRRPTLLDVEGLSAYITDRPCPIEKPGKIAPVENNTSGYISRVCREMQVPNTYVPDVDDRATMCAFAAAISQVENGVPAVMADVAAGWELL